MLDVVRREGEEGQWLSFVSFYSLANASSWMPSHKALKAVHVANDAHRWID